MTELDDDQSVDFLQALARAASPAERIAGGWLRPSGDPVVGELRLLRWTQRIADGRPDRVAEILAEHGFTLDQWRIGLGGVAVRPGEPLPAWVSDALMLLDLVGTEPGPHVVPLLREVVGDGLPDWVDGDQPWRFHPGFRDWLAAAGRAVDTWSAAAPMSETAKGDLVLDLARRQLGVAGPLLMQAAAARPAAEPLFGSDPRSDWATLWTTHPVVARLLATTWRQWRETTAEVCGRISADLPTLLPGVEVVQVELSAGDQHCDGRGVSRLRLSDGTSVFLKPRADRLYQLLGAVLTRVDDHGPALGIGPARSLPRIIEKDGYTWVLEVPAGDCADAGPAVDKYFRRAGALLRVLQALGATDLHHENFVPTSDLPVLVDLETAISPGPLRTAPPEDAISQRLWDTPGPTSMVTSAVSGAPGMTAADIGALAGPTQARTPYWVRTLVQTAAGPELQATRAPMENGRALPTVAGRPVSLRGHEQALLDGYADAGQRLAALATADATTKDLLPEGISGSEQAPLVRFVARATRTYSRLLLQGTAPAALVDGVERELVLELLYRATGTAPAGLIACEVEAMRDLDVPLFTIPFAGADLVSDRGVVLADALTQAPDVRTLDRLRAVAARDDHVDDLRATLFAMDPGHRAGPDGSAGATGRRRRTGEDPAEPVDLAEPVALLLDRAIDPGDGTVSWIGLEHDPNHNRWAYGRLRAGLTGQAGVGLALATVGSQSAMPSTRLTADCAAAARAALLGSVQRVGAGTIGPSDAFGGPAGVLYAAAVGGRLLGDRVLLDGARSLIEPCLLAARRNQPSLVIDGAAGAVLALLQLPQDGAVADALTELGTLLERTEPATETDVPDRWAASLPSRALGTALARHRLSLLRPSERTGHVAEPPVAILPGDEIAVAAMHPPLAPTRPIPADPSLRELLDHAALAQAALHFGGCPAWAVRRADIVGVLVERRRVGRWAGPLIAPDTTLLSPIHGLAALAALFSACDTNSGREVPIVRALS